MSMTWQAPMTSPAKIEETESIVVLTRPRTQQNLTGVVAWHSRREEKMGKAQKDVVEQHQRLDMAVRWRPSRHISIEDPMSKRWWLKRPFKLPHDCVGNLASFSSRVCHQTPLTCLEHCSRAMLVSYHPDQLVHWSPQAGGKWHSVH